MTQKYKFIVFTQNWAPNSNGVKILYNLSLEIEKCGYESYLFIFDKYNLKDIPKEYSRKVIEDIDDLDENTIVIFPDTLPSELSLKIACKNRVWYFLNKPMVLSGNQINIFKNDIIVSFSRLVYSNEFQLFYNSKVEGIDDIIKLISNKEIKKKNQIAIYYGKARSKNRFKVLFLKFTLGCKIIPITRSIPNCKKELLRLLAESKLLVTFDPLTNLNYESTLCNTPVFVADNYAGIKYNDYNIPQDGFFENYKQIRSYYKSGLSDEVYKKICKTYYVSIEQHHYNTKTFIEFISSRFSELKISNNEMDIERQACIIKEYQKLQSEKKLVNHNLSEYYPIYSIKIMCKLIHLYFLSRILNLLLFIFCTLLCTNKSLRAQLRKTIRNKKYEIIIKYSQELRIAR